MLSELRFYEELNIILTNHAFKGYAMSYNIEIIERKDPIHQLEASKWSIKDLFSDPLNETRGFKYQITLKVTLKMLFKKFCTWLIIGLMKDLAVLLNQWSLNTLTFQLTDLIRKFLCDISCWIKKFIKRTNQHQKWKLKMFFMVSC